MSIPSPAAGKSHTVVFKYANDTQTIGLVIPDMEQYQKQPYTPFSPSIRAGEATQKDFAISSVWEIQNDWSGGTGHLIENDAAETTRYAFAQGKDLTGTTTIGPCLYTARTGRLYPPPAETATVSTANFKFFIEFKTKLYGATSDAAGKIYEHDGTNWTLRETLTATCTQLFTDGATLFACQGASNAVRKSTDGTTWSNHTFNAHFMAKREEDNTAYIATATLTPNTDGTGPAYRSPVIGWSGTTATAMVYYAGKLWIGKPEGLYTWEQGWIDRVEDTSAAADTSNFKWMCIHRGLLYYNVKNKLYFTNGDSRTEVTPDDLNGFTAIDSMASTAGPLLIGARMQSRSYLFYFAGVDKPGLNPLWSDADASLPVVACGATDLFNSRPRVYLCQTTTGTVYLDFATNWTPNSYHTKGTTQSYIDLTLFTAGFRSVKKWFYECVLNVEDPTANTKANIWYSVDDGAWTQMLDETGAAATLSLSASNHALFFPLNTSGVKLKLRIEMWTTNASTVAAITAVTVRGATMPKLRHQFSFPVSAGTSVQGFNALATDSTANIEAAFDAMTSQTYPVKFQDWDGSWYLVMFRTPYPLQAITSFSAPDGVQNASAEKIYQVMLVEVDELSATGAYNAWTPG